MTALKKILIKGVFGHAILMNTEIGSQYTFLAHGPRMKNAHDAIVKQNEECYSKDRYSQSAMDETKNSFGL